MRDYLRSPDSYYTPLAEGENQRLAIQGQLSKAFDSKMFEYALQPMKSSVVGLDLGCAWGQVTRERFGNFEQFSKIIGVDLPQECLAYARKTSQEKYRYFSIDLETEHTAQELSKALALKSLSTPVVAFCSLVLHHLRHPEKFLQMLRQVLPRGSCLIVRTIDEGSIMAYPDPQSRVERVVGVGIEYPHGTDRFHGRKLHHQLSGAGFSDIRLFIQPYALSSFPSIERLGFFKAEYGFRLEFCRRALEQAGMVGEERDGILHALARDIHGIEMDFADPAYTYLMSSYGAVARL